MRAIGGVAHDRWFNIDLDRMDHVVVPVMPKPTAFAVADMLAEPTSPDRMIYTVNKLIWPGFRFPVRVLVAPDVRIQGHPAPYDSCWPNPLVSARCRCEEIGWPALLGTASACHLDHCPIHGRFTFAPITPLSVSTAARDRWLAGRQAADQWNRLMGQDPGSR